MFDGHVGGTGCAHLILQCECNVIAQKLVQSLQILWRDIHEFDPHLALFYPFHTHQVTDRSRSPLLMVYLSQRYCPRTRRFPTRSPHPRRDRLKTWPSAIPDLSATATRRQIGLRSCRRGFFCGVHLSVSTTLESAFNMSNLLSLNRAGTAQEGATIMPDHDAYVEGKKCGVFGELRS